MAATIKEQILLNNLKIWTAACEKVNMLRHEHEKGMPLNEFIFLTAVKNNDLDILQYLHENKCPWHNDSYIFAAAYGSLAALKFLHENGYEWDEKVCTNAAKFGHLDCLQYAHENGCKWNYKKIYKWASDNKNLEMITYLTGKK